ncbi:uncharacterized protein [Asterias amurensis]|uniref:uncharacterized protein isoform X1 n=1 Tax=Asterias amurensis TaxID=7602 RepID=UPI003AB68EEF
MANTGLLATLSTIVLVLAVFGTLTPTRAQLTQHQRMLMEGGGAYGKRTQNELRPVNYLNLMDEEAGDSVEVEKEPMPNSLALYLAHLSPGKRHMLSQLLAMTRMNSEAENE